MTCPDNCTAYDKIISELSKVLQDRETSGGRNKIGGVGNSLDSLPKTCCPDPKISPKQLNNDEDFNKDLDIDNINTATNLSEVAQIIIDNVCDYKDFPQTLRTLRTINIEFKKIATEYLTLTPGKEIIQRFKTKIKTDVLATTFHKIIDTFRDQMLSSSLLGPRSWRYRILIRLNTSNIYYKFEYLAHTTDDHDRQNMFTVITWNDATLFTAAENINIDKYFKEIDVDSIEFHDLLSGNWEFKIYKHTDGAEDKTTNIQYIIVFLSKENSCDY